MTSQLVYIFGEQRLGWLMKVHNHYKCLSGQHSCFTLNVKNWVMKKVSPEFTIHSKELEVKSTQEATGNNCSNDRVFSLILIVTNDLASLMQRPLLPVRESNIH